MCFLYVHCQFDPSNPGAAPILINTPGQPGALQLGPSPTQLPVGMAGPAVAGPTSAAGLGIFQQLSSSASMPPSLQQQLGAAVGGSVVVASTMVTSTVTTNALSSCISSPAVSAVSSSASLVAAGKGIKVGVGQQAFGDKLKNNQRHTSFKFCHGDLSDFFLISHNCIKTEEIK